MEMKVGLTFACMNLKKLAKMIARKGKRGAQKRFVYSLSNAQFLCIAFFCPFSRLDSLHTIPIEKESTTKGALFYEIW